MKLAEQDCPAAPSDIGELRQLVRRVFDSLDPVLFEPFAAFKAVSIAQCNDLVNGEDPIGRFLDVDEEGFLWLVDMASEVHETIALRSHDEFVRTSGTLSRSVVYRSTASSLGADGKMKRADMSYRPLANPPPGVQLQHFVTTVLEVGYHQGWNGPRGLLAKKDWWLANTTAEEVLIIHCSKKYQSLRAQLWQRTVGGIVGQPIIDFSAAGAAPHVVQLSARACLRLPAGAPLPAGVVDPQLDLDFIRQCVLDLPVPV